MYDPSTGTVMLIPSASRHSQMLLRLCPASSAAVEQELSGREDHLTGAEERLAASIEQVRHDLFRLMRAQQALFAYVDTLAKTILTCMPEPPADAKPQAVARAKERYDRLLKTPVARWSAMQSSQCRI